MKKLNFNNGFKAIAIAFFLIFSINKVSGQCPYSIVNNTGCNYTYDIAWYEFSGGSTCQTTPCNTQIGSVLPANQSQPISCPCNNYCNIVITITDVNGTSTTIIADFNTASSTFFQCTTTGNVLSFNSGSLAFEIN